MKTRKMIVALLVGAILLPSLSFAQTTTSVAQPTRDELVMKLIASLMEQIKVLQAQLATLKEKEKAEAIAKQATTTPEKPVVNEFVSKKAILTGNIDQNINLTPVESGNYPLVPVLEFALESVDSSATLSKITVSLTVTEGAKVSKVYLYQGDSVPLASAVVSKGTATFIVPSGTNGSTFGSNIPAKFTIKADVTDVDFNIENNVYKGRPSDIGRPYTVTSFESFEVTSSIKSSDVQVIDSMGRIFKTITGTATGKVKAQGTVCEGYCA